MPVLLRVFLSMSLGILIGFVLPPLATHAHYAHQGYSLYNVGFAGGIIATVIVSVLKSFGITVEARQIWYSGRNASVCHPVIRAVSGNDCGRSAGPEAVRSLQDIDGF